MYCNLRFFTHVTHVIDAREIMEMSQLKLVLTAADSDYNSRLLFPSLDVGKSTELLMFQEDRQKFVLCAPSPYGHLLNFPLPVHQSYVKCTLCKKSRGCYPIS